MRNKCCRRVLIAFTLPFSLLVVIAIRVLTLNYQNTEARRIVKSECVTSQVFKVINVTLWKAVEFNFKNDRVNLRNLYRLETPVADWKDDTENPSIRRSLLTLRANGSDVLQIKDIAYAPRSIFSDIGIVQRVIGFHCLQEINSNYSQIVFNFGKI